MRARTARGAGALLALAIAIAPALAGAAEPSAAPGPVRHAITIRDGQVPRAQRTVIVPHEAAVQLEWSADRPTTVHLEGYDISVVVNPGEPATMAFRAYATGRFPVHAHEGAKKGAAKSHAHGRGALAHLEVHPK